MPRESRKLMLENENLLQICLDLHGYVKGSNDFYDYLPYGCQRHVKILKSALEHWQEPSSKFDSIVYSLIEETLFEIEVQEIEKKFPEIPEEIKKPLSLAKNAMCAKGDNVKFYIFDYKEIPEGISGIYWAKTTGDFTKYGKGLFPKGQYKMKVVKSEDK